MTEGSATPLTLDEYEERAKEVLPKMAYDYFRSGAEQQVTLKRNRKAFRKLEIWYRVLVDVSEVDTTCRVLGRELAMPILVAPTAYHRLACDDGEAATARGAEAAGTLMCVSTLATVSLEEVAEASSGPKWFQLYVHKDRGLTKSLVERAEAAGYEAVVLTVDAPVLGRRLADERNLFALPEGLSMQNLMGTEMLTAGAPDGSALTAYVAERHDSAVTWADVDWLRSITGLPLLMKGIVRADDARRAADAGAAGVIVSNHGGRQMDSAPASIDALPGVVDAVGGEVEVLMDGGIRTGTDVLIALGLGARAVMIGRPILWGLAVAADEGVDHVLQLLREELAGAMRLAGCPDVSSIDRDLVRAAR